MSRPILQYNSNGATRATAAGLRDGAHFQKLATLAVLVVVLLCCVLVLGLVVDCTLRYLYSVLLHKRKVSQMTPCTVCLMSLLHTTLLVCGWVTISDPTPIGCPFC